MFLKRIKKRYVWKAEGGNQMHPLTAYAVPSPYKQGESALREEAFALISFLIRISGKPSLAHALLLLKEFFDTPK